MFRDPERRLRSAGTYPTRRDALRAANREEQRCLRGLGTTPAWATSRSPPTSRPSGTTTRAAYLSYLNKHFYPYFGQRLLNRISPSLVQDWVAKAVADGLSPRSIRKYHVLLSSIFGRAVKDRVLVHNPCDHTELPKVITRKKPTLTPEEYQRLVAATPEPHRLMVETLMETGVRWGELVALKPRHIDFLRRTLTVEETIVKPPRNTSTPSPTPTKPASTPSPASTTTAGPGHDRRGRTFLGCWLMASMDGRS